MSREDGNKLVMWILGAVFAVAMTLLSFNVNSVSGDIRELRSNVNNNSAAIASVKADYTATVKGIESDISETREDIKEIRRLLEAQRTPIVKQAQRLRP